MLIGREEAVIRTVSARESKVIINLVSSAIKYRADKGESFLEMENMHDDEYEHVSMVFRELGYEVYIDADKATVRICWGQQC